MFEAKDHARTIVPERMMLCRLAQSEKLREFFIQMWMQNPLLPRQCGVRVQNLLTSLGCGNEVISPNTPSALTADIEGDEK